MKTNYHTHVELCGHATGMSSDYIEKAIELGLVEIGISDHAPIPREWMSVEQYKYNWLDRQMSLDTFYNIYLPDLRKSIVHYSSKISIFKGLEIEFVENKEDYYLKLLDDLDYLILGVHYILIDGVNYNSYEDLNFENVHFYADNIEKALKTGYFGCLVHPDLFLFNYLSKNSQKYEFDDEADRVSRRIIEAAISNDVVLEINCGGIRKGKIVDTSLGMQYLYPREEFWKIASEYVYGNLKICTSAIEKSSP